MIRRILAVLAIVTLVGGVVIYKLWTKPHPAIGGATVSISATDLTKEYLKDERSADSLYLNKTIEVSGIIKEVNKDTSGVSLTLESGNDLASVSCTMDIFKTKADNSFAVGERAVLKGVCLGKNAFDINVDRCERVK